MPVYTVSGGVKSFLTRLEKLANNPDSEESLAKEMEAFFAANFFLLYEDEEAKSFFSHVFAWRALRLSFAPIIF